MSFLFNASLQLAAPDQFQLSKRDYHRFTLDSDCVARGNTTGLRLFDIDVMVLVKATAFLSAFLMFWLEFLAAKMLLPWLGGTPAVWTTAIVFFQLLLLMGYALADQMAKLPLIWFVRLQIGGLGLTMLQLPLTLHLVTTPIPNVVRVWLSLTFSIGAVFLGITTVSPVLQSWVGRLPDRNPYSLYAIGNFGSFSSLVLYPVLLEQHLTLTQQQWICSVLYGLLVFCLFVISYLIVRETPLESAASENPLQSIKLDPPWSQLGYWILLAAMPASLSLSVTTTITSDVSNTPLTWALPLGVYLLTFVAAFSQPVKNSVPISAFIRIALAIAVFGGLIVIGIVTRNGTLSLHLLLLLILGFLLHDRLYALRPPTAHLTQFYLCVSLGGVLGGLFNQLVAPFVFQHSVTEYPLTLFASVLVLVSQQSLKMQFRRVFQYFLVALLSLILLLGVFPAANAVASYRNFFGIYKVIWSDGLKVLSHNTTIHGAQRPGSLIPISYYSAFSPISQLFELANRFSPLRQIGVVGLGAGSLFAYAQPGQQWGFIEIDPLVVEIAQRHFDYLAARPDQVKVIVGDGRLALKQLPQNLDLLLLDAFSSDMVPPHLLTEQAVQAYLQQIQSGGVLAFNLSNRYLDLAPVVGNLAQAHNLLALVKRHTATPDQVRQGIVSSTWAVLVDPRFAQPELLRSLRREWTQIPPSQERLWTDDYSSILPYLVGLRRMPH